MSTNEQLVLRAEQAAQQTAQNKAEIEAMVTKLEQVQAPAIAAAKEDIKQAIIEKGQTVDNAVPFSEYGNKIRSIKVGEILPVSTPTVTDNVVTIPAGKIEENTEVTVGTAKAAKSYTPTTKNQTIAAGTYLTGTQTIKGDADLVAGNIKTGVSIFNVTGTFTSDADATAEDIAEGKSAYVNGVKITGTAVSGDVGSGEGGDPNDSDDTPLLLMHFNGNLNINGKSSNALAKPLQWSAWDYESWAWSPTYDTGVFGRQCLSFPPPTEEEMEWGEYTYKFVDLPITNKFISKDFTIDFWVKPVSGHCMTLSFVDSFDLVHVDENSKVSAWFGDGNNVVPIIDRKPLTPDAWNHIAMVRSASNFYFFINGQKQTFSGELWHLTCQIERQLRVGRASSPLSVGGFDELRIVQKALWTDNFTPPTSEDNTHDVAVEVVLDAPFKGDLTTTPQLTNYGATIGTRGGVTCAVFNNEQFMRLSNFQVPGRNTISLWVYFDNSSSYNILTYGSGSNGEPVLIYRNGTIVIDRGDQGSDEFPGSSVALNAWTHVCMTCVSGLDHRTKVCLYLNGVKLGENSPRYLSFYKGLTLCGYNASTLVSGINGGIRDLKIFNEVLSEQEILTIYNTGIQ